LHSGVTISNELFDAERAGWGVAALFRWFGVRGQRPLEFLFDAQGIGGGARPEFPQGMQIAFAPGDQSLRVFPARAEKGDDAVGE
jgi:hypothetical protein